MTIRIEDSGDQWKTEDTEEKPIQTKAVNSVSGCIDGLAFNFRFNNPKTGWNIRDFHTEVVQYAECQDSYLEDWQADKLCFLYKQRIPKPQEMIKILGFIKAKLDRDFDYEFQTGQNGTDQSCVDLYESLAHKYISSLQDVNHTSFITEFQELYRQTFKQQ